MNKKKAVTLTVFLAAAVLAAAFAIKDMRSRNRQKSIIFIPKVIDKNNDFWSSLIEGAEMAAEEYKIDLKIWASESENDFGTQIDLINRAIEEKPDAILLTPISYSQMTEAVEKIKEAGIYLVIADSTVDKQVEDVLIATDNFEAGTKMGAFIREKLPQNPVIGIVAHVQGSSTALEREKGFRSGLGEEYEKNIVGTVFTDSNYEKAYRVTEELLAEHPDINVLVGLNEYSAVGAARAVRDMGLENRILMIGFDSSLEEIQLLEEGVFQAIVIQKPFNMGYLGIEAAYCLMEGKSTQADIDSGSVLITKDTIYTEENEKLLFPFYEKQGAGE